MSTEDSWHRRDILKAAAIAATPLSFKVVDAQDVSAASPGIASVSAYLEGLRTPDGGYGWGDGDRSHLTPTFGAIGCYHIIGQQPANASAAAEYVRTHHPFAVKKLEREMHSFEYQQICTLQWLGEDVSGFREQVASWRKPFSYAKAYEKHGYPIFEYEAMAFVCRQLLGLPMDTVSQEFIAYLESRRRDDGSFNNTPAADGSGGHVLNTLWGIRSFNVLGRWNEHPDSIVSWLKRCQREDGGFTWQPDPSFAGNVDVVYTWAAVRGL
ncbi:MAG: prenyltransferase, partial [Planctomycetota bacterium]|nr:prenyltransferase [Planctomycetota bacterium]